MTAIPTTSNANGSTRYMSCILAKAKANKNCGRGMEVRNPDVPDGVATAVPSSREIVRKKNVSEARAVVSELH